MNQRDLSGVKNPPQGGVACNTTPEASVSLKGPLKDKGVEFQEDPFVARRQIADAIQIHNVLMKQIVTDSDQALNNPYVHLALRIAKQPKKSSILLWRTKSALNNKLDLPPRCTHELFSNDHKSHLIRAFLSNTTPSSYQMMKQWEHVRLMASTRARELARMLALYETICSQQTLFHNDPITIKAARRARSLCAQYGQQNVQVFPIQNPALQPTEGGE